MKRKEIISLYRENTSKYSKVYHVFEKLDLLVTPILLLGIFFGDGWIDLICTIILIIFVFTQLILLILDSYHRIKIGKRKMN